MATSVAAAFSGGQKIGIGVVGTLVLIGLGFYFGPMRVSSEWDALQPKASQDVQDLVIDSLREQMKHEDFDGKVHRFQPTVESHDVTFLQPMLAFSMPEQVGFIGKSNQGTFGGNYNTRTGEVDATVSHGGYTVGGMVDAPSPPAPSTSAAAWSTESRKWRSTGRRFNVGTRGRGEGWQPMYLVSGDARSGARLPIGTRAPLRVAANRAPSEGRPGPSGRANVHEPVTARKTIRSSSPSCGRSDL